MKNLLIIICVLIPFMAQSQTDGTFIYNGGFVALYRHIGQTINYPDRTKIGTMLVSWTVTNGQVENISFLNSINSKFERELMNTIELTKGNWKEIDTTYHFVLPIKFRSEQIDFFVDEYPKSYLEEVSIVAYGSNGSAQIVFKTDDQLIEKLNDHIKKERFDKAIPLLDEIIIRNPMSKQIRETRIYCYKKMEMSDFACKDIQFVNYLFQIKSKYQCD